MVFLFFVKEGEIFALLGPNGAGKTTTLRILTTILKPDSGEAFINGYNILKEPEKVRKSIGFLPGDTGLYHRLTPSEFVEIFASLYGLQKDIINKRKKEVFESLGIERYSKTIIDKLSEGTKQKVLLSKILISDPPVLVLDEPAQGLDVVAAKLLEEYLLKLKKEGKTILISTHIMEQAEYLADRIGIINEGKITYIGRIEEMRDKTGKKTLREMFLALLK
ncbi:MAG: ABC transporter ATP-binding protein [Candidatus Hydrothermales bacterium]